MPIQTHLVTAQASANRDARVAACQGAARRRRDSTRPTAAPDQVPARDATRQNPYREVVSRTCTLQSKSPRARWASDPELAPLPAANDCQASPTACQAKYADSCAHIRVPSLDEPRPWIRPPECPTIAEFGTR